MGAHSFAYLFERFPSFVQTFVYREVAEMVRQGMAPLLVSMRPPEDPVAMPALDPLILQMPLAADIRQRVQLPLLVRWRTPKQLREKDANRLFEALWLGPVLKKHGIKHVHAHFAGMAARLAWWLQQIYGFTYSFTGHANDIFCENDYPVSNGQLVAGAKFVVTETDFARRWMEEKYPGAKGKIHRVFNGIDSLFPPVAKQGEVPRIVSIGRYVEKKGFGDLIEACRILAQRGHRFECLIVGGGPMERELAAQIDEAGLHASVRLLGPRAQEEVRALLVTADVFALACVPEVGGGSDNLPTVIMEAMMAGVPVVSTRLAGVPEMIEDRLSGLLVEPGSPELLAQALETFLLDTGLAGSCARTAMAVAREKFSVQNTTERLKELLISRAGVRVGSGA